MRPTLGPENDKRQWNSPTTTKIRRFIERSEIFWFFSTWSKRVHTKKTLSTSRRFRQYSFYYLRPVWFKSYTLHISHTYERNMIYFHYTTSSRIVSAAKYNYRIDISTKIQILRHYDVIRSYETFGAHKPVFMFNCFFFFF